jgi:divalent metal cation (Fe/Co/Zn/Cd) transporter
MLNKLYNGMYWASAIEFAFHGLLQFLLTVLKLVTLFAALIFGLRDAGRYLPQMNPIVGLVVKVTLLIVLGFVLTEFSRTIFMFISSVSGLNPFAGYKP